MEKVVIALGGNALQSKGSDHTAKGQLLAIQRAAGQIARLCARGYEISIVHGNGPQVGSILLASETAKDITPAMPFDVCGAMSQGYIGYHIQQVLGDALKKAGISTPVNTVVTQVVVDKKDKAFSTPSKPIGPFYSREEAERLSAEKGYTMREDAGRGWRRVVPSPAPLRIVEIASIKAMQGRSIVISCGGGGIPVVETESGALAGVAAVIDKDLAAALLAQELEADVLLILTEVEKAAIHWGKPEQRDLAEVSAGQMERYIQEGHFAPGSMLPKVQAALKFVRGGPGRRAVITSLDKACEALSGATGTIIRA